MSHSALSTHKAISSYFIANKILFMLRFIAHWN
jgi:hypothetical protein